MDSKLCIKQDMAEQENSSLANRVIDVQREPNCWLLPIEGYENLPLVSLEEATKPLTRIVPDIARLAMIAKRNCENPKDGLSTDESAAIMLYTTDREPEDTSLYFLLNQTLRQKDRSRMKPWYSYFRLILSGLGKLPSERKLIYRGVKLDLHEKYRKDSVVVWWAFSSCTSKLETLESERFLGKTGPRTFFIIQCHTGKNIRNHSYYGYEDEILLPPASQFHVRAIMQHDDGLNIIQLEETEPDVPLLGSGDYAPKNNRPKTARLVRTQLTYFNHVNPQLHRKIDEYAESKHINLTYLNLCDEDIPVVVTCGILQKACTKLDLSQNRITSEGFIYVSAALRNNLTLEKLYIAENRLTDEAIDSLVKSLSKQNTTLRELGLGSNNIKNLGAKVLAEILAENQTLQTLGLNNNEVGDQGTQALMHTLANSNRGLRILNLSMNKAITDASIESIIDMLEKNQTIEELHLLRCGFSSAGKKRLETAAGQSERLKL